MKKNAKILTLLLSVFYFSLNAQAFICCFSGNESVEDLNNYYKINLNTHSGDDKTQVQIMADQIVNAIRNGLEVEQRQTPLNILFVSKTGILKDKCFLETKSQNKDDLSELYKKYDIIVSPCGGLELLNFISN